MKNLRMFILILCISLLIPVQVFASSDYPDELDYDTLDSLGIADAEYNGYSEDEAGRLYYYIKDDVYYTIASYDGEVSISSAIPMNSGSEQTDDWEDTADYATDDIDFESALDNTSRSTNMLSMLTSSGVGKTASLGMLCFAIGFMLVNLIPWVKICRSLGMSPLWMLVPVVGWVKAMNRAMPDDFPKRNKIVYCQLIPMLFTVLAPVVVAVATLLGIIGVIIAIIIFGACFVEIILLMVRTAKGIRIIDAAVKCIEYEETSVAIGLIYLFVYPVWFIYVLVKY